MRTTHVVHLSIVLLAVASSVSRLHAAPVVISATENWNGVSIPGGHAADGVTLLAGVYTIPDGIVFNAGGLMQLNGATTNIGFSFLSGGGGMTFNTTANAIDAYEGFRDGTSRFVTFNLNNNSITSVAGGGKIFHSTPGDDPRNIAINSTAGGAIGMTSIITQRSDSQQAGLTITAGGAVSIGTINVSDAAPGGSEGGNVSIQAPEITLGDISTFTNRTSAGTITNGNIFLEALGDPTFDETVALDNRLENKLTLTGTLRTEGTSALNQPGGDITLRGVVVSLTPTFDVVKEADAVLAIFAGVLQDGFTAADLFQENAPGTFTATFNVEWLSVVPEPSTFVLMSMALVGVAVKTRRRRRDAA